MKVFKIKHIYLFIIISITASCSKKDNTTIPDSGKIAIKFTHKINGFNLHFDTLIYTNTAGNQYLINEIQYFLSDFTLHKHSGESIRIKNSNNYHYIDTNIPSSFTWNISDSINIGNYDSISFTFGFNLARNKSNTFVNPPESNMFWPEMMGGGYHYMKMNGKWKLSNNNLAPFNFHLGIGQIYQGTTYSLDSISSFVQNYFTVKLPSSTFIVTKNKNTTIEIVMNIDKWFSTPNTFDFNYWGGSIMQNQAAMNSACQNGKNVFSIGTIE